MIRILQCVPGNMNMGGIENFIMNMYRNIDLNNIQFDFIVHSNEKNYYENEIINKGGIVYHLPNKAKHPIKYIMSLKKIFENNNYNTVHIHSTYAISIIDVFVAKKSKIKNIILHSHNTNAIFKRKIIHYLFKKIQERNVNYKFACGVEAAKWMYSKKTINNNKYKVINNSIDTDKYIYNRKIRNKIRDKLKIKGNSIIVGSVGRFSYQKNPEKILSVFKNINKIKPDSKLIMIGDGELKPKVIKLIEEYGLKDNCILTGNINNVNEYLQAMDIFILPSRYEGLPIVLVEAQASGLKSIISSTITDETKLTDLIIKIDINESDEIWSKVIIDNYKYKRKNQYKKIVAGGYDNLDNIKKMEKFYLNIN